MIFKTKKKHCNNTTRNMSNGDSFMFEYQVTKEHAGESKYVGKAIKVVGQGECAEGVTITVNGY